MLRDLGLRSLAVLLGLALARGAHAALAATSMAGWIDDPGASTMSIHSYTTFPNTQVELYRGTVLSTQIDVPGNLLFSGTFPGGVNMPGQALDFYPTNYLDVDSGTNYYASSYCVIKGDKTLLWEFDTYIGNTPSTDRQTFLTSNNATHLGVHYYTWLSTGVNNNHAGGRGFGDALAIINPNAAPVTIDFFRGFGRGASGTYWDPIYTRTIAANSIFMLGGSIDMRYAPATLALAGNSYFYGTWSQGSGSSNPYDAGDYAIASRGAPIMVWKSNMFACDSTNEPNDHISYGVDALTGAKVGREVYGVIGKYTAVNQIRVTNMSGLATTYNIYRYVPTNPVPVGGTYDRAFPTGESAAGTWVLETGPVALGAAMGTSQGHSYAYDPGAFVKVVADQDIQAAIGAGFIQSEYGDGDYVEGTVNHEPLDLEFYVSESVCQGAPRTALAIMAPYAGTVVTISANPARAGFPLVLPATTTVYQALRVNLSDLCPTDYRITTNADNAHPVYVYYQSVGTGAFGGTVEKFFSCATPKTNLPLLTINKLASRFTATAGDQITYTINYVNAGTGIANGVEILDTIPAYTQYVSDTGPSGSWVTGSGAAGSLRRWDLGTVGIGSFGSFQVVLQVLPNPSLSTGTHVINNQVVMADNAGNSGYSQPALTLNVNNPLGSWVSYTALDQSSAQPTDVNFFTLQPNCNVTLYNATASDLQINNTVFTGLSHAFQRQSYSVPAANRTYFKVVADYPINWEIDTRNTTGASNSTRQMFAYSTDMNLKDKVFLTQLYAQTSAGAPQTNWGDSICVVNPHATRPTRVYLYQSPDNGVTWNQIAGTNLQPRSIYRYGGVTATDQGLWMTVSLDEDVMVYKGTALSTNYNDTRAQLAAVADQGKGRKVATAPTSFYGGAADATNSVIVTNSGLVNLTYNIYRYNSTPVGTWPISGNNGTWTLVAGPLTIAPGANGYYTPAVRTFYRVDLTAGTGQVQMGGSNQQDAFNGGDGDCYEGVAESGVDWLASGGTQTGGRGQRFWVAQNNNSSGSRIDIIAPVAGTILSRGLGVTGAWMGVPTDPNPWPAATGGIDRGYQAFPDNPGAFWVSSQDMAHPIYVLEQSANNNYGCKSFPCIPLVLAVTLTPTATATSTPTYTSTPTPTPSYTPTPSRTATPSSTSTPTPSSTATPTPSASSTATPTASATSTGTPTSTPTRTASPSSTATPSPTATPTATSTATATPSSTSTPTPTASITSTATATVTSTSTATATRTASPSPSSTFTATPSSTTTATPTASITFTSTSSASPTATITATRTATPSSTATPTPSSSSTLTATPTPSVTSTATPSQTATSTLTATPTATPTYTPTATPSSSSTQTFTRTITPSQTSTITPSETPSITLTHTASPPASATNTSTSTISPTQTPTSSITPTDSPTYTPSPSSTFTSTPTATATESPSSTPTHTPTATPSYTATASPSSTRTATPTSTATETPSHTPTESSTPTPSATATPTATATETPSITLTHTASPPASDTASPTASETPSISPTATASSTETATPTATSSATPTASDTLTPTPSATPTPTPTESSTSSPSDTPTATSTATPTPTVSPTPSDSATVTLGPSPTDSPSFTATPSSSETTTSTATPTATGTVESPTYTASGTPTASPTPTSTATPSATPSSTSTATPTSSATPTASPTFTDTPSTSATYTSTPTPSSTASPTATATPTFTATPTASASSTATPTITFTATASRTATASATSTATSTATPTSTASATSTSTATITLSPTATPYYSPTPTLTITPTWTATPVTRLVLFKGAYPNPFSEDGKIFYVLRNPSEVEVDIYNVAGEFLLKRRASLPAGPHIEVWDGRNADGGRCASGVYLVHVKARSLGPGERDDFWVTLAIAR